MDKFFTAVQTGTESWLTKRKAKRAWAKSQKKPRTFLSEVLDWLEAILFAVVVVLILNQYLFQLYVIPTPSMVSTLNVKDRVLVGKTSYGIEVYPSGPKILDSKTPERDHIITFYNPEYVSRGPVFDVLSTLLYMATFTFVNIDRDADGNPKEKLYVKRVAGLPGDTFNFENGNAIIRAAGTEEFILESEFRAEHNLSDGPHRSMDETQYAARNALAMINGYAASGVTAYPQHLLPEAQKLGSIYPDYDAEKYYTRAQRYANPSDMTLRDASARYTQGIYVPEGRILPLGDNRDNSRDGRYFGPVSVAKVNGKVLSRVWPLSEMTSF